MPRSPTATRFGRSLLAYTAFRPTVVPESTVWKLAPPSVEMVMVPFARTAQKFSLT